MQTAKVIVLKPAAAPQWTKIQQKFLRVLAVPGNREKSVLDICKLAGYKSFTPWYGALKDEQFAARVEELGYQGKHFPPHTEVTLARDPEEELAKDVWDMRRLKAEYPKHSRPSEFVVDFTKIANPVLRQQVKQYFRLHLPQWKAATFQNNLNRLVPILTVLPSDVHVGTVNRKHVETLVAYSQQLGQESASRGMSSLRTMLDYMATNAAWQGPRPPRFLVYPEDIPSRPDTLPRPIPPDVVDQFDALLDKAVAAMKASEEPPILTPMLWDALLILRRTGMRTEDVCHLKGPDANGKNGCLDQDSEGYWWIRIDSKDHKMGKDHRIPTKESDGTVDAIRRQVQRIARIEDHFGKRLLFRHRGGAMSYSQVNGALGKLTEHLSHEGGQYKIAPHQFRHTIATDMIEMGIDLRTVQEFLGHVSLEMTQKYVKVYLSTLKKRYDEYRAKRAEIASTTSAATMISDNLEVMDSSSETDGGWVPGRVGQLYRSPLAGGEGVCDHLPMLDPCPDIPKCSMCTKFKAFKHHLPYWERMVTNIQLSVEALKDNPKFSRSLQRHEQELEHAKHIVKTIKEVGFFDGRIHNAKAQ